MAGLSTTGFSIKRLEEIKTSMEELASSLFQDLVPVGDAVDTSESTTIGRLIGLVSPSTSDLWEAGSDVYAAFNAETATGVALDNITALLNINRLKATGSNVGLILQGNIGTSITTNTSKVKSVSSGFLYTLQPVEQVYTTFSFANTDNAGIVIDINTVASSTNYTVSYSFDNIVYTNVTINSGVGATKSSIFTALKTAINTSHSAYLTASEESGLLFIRAVDYKKLHYFTVSANITITKSFKYVNAVCDTVGLTSEPVNSVNQIATPLTGWDSAYNPEIATLGRLDETDEELRARFFISKFQQARSEKEAIDTAVRAISGVSEVYIYENKTSSTDANSIPAYNNVIIVRGGADSEVAEAISNNLSLNTRLHGNTSTTVYDYTGNPIVIKTERPTSTRLYVSMNISYTNGVLSTIIPDIKQALVDYFKTFTIGQTVLYSRIFTPVNAIGGFYINSLYIDDDPTLTSVDVVNIPIAFNKYANLDIADITISVT